MYMRRISSVSPALAAGLLLLGGAAATANPESERLRVEAAAHIYNLDHEQGIALYRRAAEADPDDAAAHRGIAAGLWLNITMRRGNMTVDDYLGRLSKPTLLPTPPPPELASAFHTSLDRALAI